jgi:DNA-binding transcriptional ArsR family regulator
MSELQLSPPQQAIRLLMSFISARALYTAAKLGIADHIDDSGNPVQEISARLGVDQSALERLLHSLSGVGVIHAEQDGRYLLTEIGKTLRAGSSNSIRDYAIYVHEFLYELFKDLPTGVVEGKPIVEKAFGAPLFEYLHQHQDKAALFHAGLANRGRIETPAILTAYEFGQYERIVDLGGGNGAFLSAVLTAYPSTSGVLLERPPAIAAARRSEGGPLPRCELIEGDYFKSVPVGGDCYIFKRVLFDHDADEVVKILRNCEKVMNPDARILIIEGLAATQNEPSIAHLMDLTFLLATTGRMRIKAEYESLLSAAGLRLRTCVPTASDVCVIEAARL